MNENTLKTFTKKEGFKVYGLNSIVYDNDDYLWISGKTPNISGYQFENRGHIIQRFNGVFFDDIPLPTTGFGKNQDISLTKRSDGLIFVNFSKNQNSRVYLLDPNSLAFEEVEITGKSINEKHSINLFNQKGIIYLIDETANHTVFYEITDSLKLNEIVKIPITEFSEINLFIKFKDYSLINSLKSGVAFYSDNGVLIEQVTPTESINKNKETIFLKMWFQSEGKYFMQFDNSDKLLEFNPKTKQFQIESKINPVDSKTIFRFYDRINFNDSNGKIIIQNHQKDGFEFLVFNKDFSKPIVEFKIPEVEYFKMASKNLNKEVVLVNHGKLYYITFPSTSIHKYLEDVSIRGMYEKADGKILISTENRDWFVLDSKTLALNKFLLSYQNKPFKLINSRGIFSGKNGYWTNNDKGIVFIDKQTNEVKLYPSYRVSAITQDNDFIYYGALANKLLRFDKRTKEHIVLAETDSLNCQKMIIHNKKLFTATNKGLLIYNDGASNLYKTPTNDFLLTVDYHPKYGLLVGTRSGKLFQFNTETKEFSLLYMDVLKASIATILFDDTDKIWLNTFGGVVAFNPITKKVTRFSMRDGLSHFEANRHSALKTKDGHFLVGTLKGLNYFHPDSLYKNVVYARLELSSLKYYSKSKEKEIKVLNPKDLKNDKSITLPVDHRNLNVKFGLTGIVDVEDLEFRYRFREKKWESLGNKCEINLISITPGKQLIEIEALDFSKNKIGESIFIKVYAEDYFYNKWWFYLIVLAVVLTILYLYLSRLRKKEQHKILEKENRAIKKDLDDFAHDLIEKNKEKLSLIAELEKLKLSEGENKNLSKLQALVDSKILTNDDWTSFKNKFESAYPNYLMEIKNKKLNLTSNEERYITLEKLNLSSDEIASMLGVSANTIRTTRYRLRKKINAPSEISITEYLETL